MDPAHRSASARGRASGANGSPPGTWLSLVRQRRPPMHWTVRNTSADRHGKASQRTSFRTLRRPVATVDQWGRAALVRTLPGVCYRSLETIDSFPGTDAPAAVVVAAPAPASTIARVAAAYRGLTRVVDLRAEAEADPLDTLVRRSLGEGGTITLRDLFALMDDADKFVLTQIEAARAEIADRSRRYEQRDEVRPFGWDDLCA